MAQKSMVPGNVDITTAGQAFASTWRTSSDDMPGGLFPMHTINYNVDEWRIKNGWPVAVPSYEIRSSTMLDITGEVLAIREPNTAVQTNALMRWIPDPTYYDETSLRWNPFYNGTESDISWYTSVDYAPVLVEDYEYRVGDERFTAQALNFDSDTRNHMWADFTASIGGSPGYTVIMVMSPNSVYGNADSPYNGIWYPGGPTPVGDTFTEEPGEYWQGLSVQGRYFYTESESKPRTRVRSISTELETNAPAYVAIVFARPETTIYVGPGPASIRQGTGQVGNRGTMSSQVVLGRTTGDVLHTADMALLDLNIYANRLSPGEIADEFAILSACYGGSE